MKWLLSKKMKFSKNQKGLTLVELLAVIVILGVIAAIAVPSIGGIISSSRTNADHATQALLLTTAERYLNDTLPNGDTATTLVYVATMVGAHYLQATPKQQSVSPNVNYTSVTISYTAANGWVATATVPSTT
jgi:type IV pilus assembly protein PilA